MIMIVIDESCNLTKDLPLVPLLLENDSDVSICNCERTAEHFVLSELGFSNRNQTVKLPTPFSNLDCIDGYEAVQQSITEAFAITRDSYRQKIRGLRTYAEFFIKKARLFYFS